MRSEFLWVEKYRPKKIDDCILPDSTKKTFKDFLEQGEIPNLLLTGPAGCGKTTVARALCEQLNCDYIIINGSDEGRFLDTVRNQAKNFASTVSLSSDAPHKVIIIDEADNTTHDVQLLLRAILRRFMATVGLSSPATSKTKSSNHFIPVALWLNSELGKAKSPQLPQDSLPDSKKSWVQKVLNLITRSW